MAGEGAHEATAEPPGRLRQFLVHPLVLLPIGVVLVFLGAVVPALLLNLLDPSKDTPLSMLVGLASGLGALAAYKAFRRWIDPAPQSVASTSVIFAECGLGVLLGFGVFVTATAVAGLLGVFTIDGVRGWGAIWYWLGVAFYSGMVEEALFRGILQRKLEAMFGTWVALVTTSAFFGIAHLANPNASLFAAFAIACEAGILLGAAYLVTRRLWLPIGIHMGWNFTQGYVFSIPVSGSRSPEGLLATRVDGPEWLTGGAFGFEASVIALALASGLGLVLLVKAHRMGSFRAPRWKRNVAEIAQTNE